MKYLNTRIDRSAGLIVTATLVLLVASFSPLAAQHGKHGKHAAGQATESGACAGCQGMAMKDGEAMQCGDKMGEGHKCGGMKGMGGKGGMKGMDRKGRMGRGMGGHGALMGNIHGLIDNHTKITREVEEIEGGVITVTRTEDPTLVETLQTHVAQMYELIENDGSIRHWDPLFVEIFKHSDKIVMGDRTARRRCPGYRNLCRSLRRQADQSSCLQGERIRCPWHGRHARTDTGARALISGN